MLSVIWAVLCRHSPPCHLVVSPSMVQPLSNIKAMMLSGSPATSCVLNVKMSDASIILVAYLSLQFVVVTYNALSGIIFDMPELVIRVMGCVIMNQPVV
jgi:hypothetical protein